MLLLLKNVFRHNYERFLAKNQKTLKNGKITNYDEERLFF